MNTTQQPQPRATERPLSYTDDTGESWVLFAAVILGMLAALNLIYGIAAVADSSFFVGDARFVLSGLNTWGWVLIFAGAAQGLVAFGVWARWTGVRWVGVAIAVLNAILQMMVMPAYPFWSLCLIALDVLVIYGLIAHGSRSRA
jgi:hypothetical protein